MGIDYSFYKLKGGHERVHPSDGFSVVGSGDFEEVAYFSHGHYIADIMDVYNSNSTKEYTEKEMDHIRKFDQRPVGVEDIRRGISVLVDLDRKVMKMPYDRELDKDGGEIKSVGFQPSDLERHVKKLDFSDDDVIFDDGGDTTSGYHSISYVTGTENVKNILKEVYKVYGLRYYYFAFPWEENMGLYKYAERELEQLLTMERIFMEEPNTQMFVTWG